MSLEIKMRLQKGFHTTADLGSTEVLVTVQISDEFYKDVPRVCGYKTYIGSNKTSFCT